MNHCFKVIWNHVTDTCVAVSEITKGQGAGLATAKPMPLDMREGAAVHFFIKPLIAALICIGFTFASHAAPLTAPPVNQLPIGEKVTSGSAHVSQSGALMVVKQTTNTAIVNWQSFNIGSQATVQFEQPSVQSVTLNRVQDNNPSQIFGQIKSNGSVFLQNPNGVYFAPGSSVDVGALLATTHSISDADFLAGRYQFNRAGALGKIINHGQLNSKLGGYIALLAPEVQNQGVVVAKGGSIILAAGETYQLQFETNDTLTNVLVSPTTLAAYVENGNAVIAPGGLVILSAQAANQIQGGVVNNTGTIQATGLVNDGGVVRLVASHRISHTGSINADAAKNASGHGGRIDLIADLGNPDSSLFLNGVLSSKGGVSGGDGGQIETSGSHVRIGEATRVATNAPSGTGGNWLIDPTDFTVGSGAGSDLSGVDLGVNLNSSNVTIMSSNGGTGSSGNIFINDAVSWSSANKLTLSAANSININNAVNVPVGGSVDLVYGTSVATGDYDFGSFSSANTQFTGSINFAGTGPGLFKTQLGTGAVVSYNVIATPSTSGGMTSTGNFALGQNYTFGSSFTTSPITGVFSGKFEGLGHTVSNLTGTGAIGLFSNSSGLIRDVGVNMFNGSATTGAGGLANTNSGVIKNSFANASIYSAINGSLGGLVGINSGLITNSFSTGSVSGTTLLGGLVGSNGSGNSASPSNILSSFSTASVTGTSVYVGGLIGQNSTSGTGASSTVTNSFATGNVSSTGANASGGLIGYNYANGINSSVVVTNSFATGNVTGPSSYGANYYFGGLIGSNTVNQSGANASVIASYATGSVTAAASWVGGLVGFNQINGAGVNGQANILNSYATGSVSNTSPYSGNAPAGIGGLVGLNRNLAVGASSTVVSSYATGTVTGALFAATYGTGGLIGYNYATASDADNSVSYSYASGIVSGQGGVGGLIGQNTADKGGKASIESSYASGNVSSATGSVGGLVGTNKADTASLASTSNISNSYASGNVNSIGGTSVGGLVGMNTTVTAANFSVISNSHATGNVSAAGDSVGGLVGFNTGSGDSRVLQSYATGSVDSTSIAGTNVGGLVGQNKADVANSKVSISQSYATGAVTAPKIAGGLVGLLSATSGTANIDQSYATGNVRQTAASGIAGGLVGQVTSSNAGSSTVISNTFATGNVTGTGSSNLGGLVGTFSAAGNGSIQNSYALGNLSGSSNMGGLIGSLSGGSNLQNNYWNTTNNPALLFDKGGIAAKVVTSGIASLSTLDMQNMSNFSNWDSNSVWQSLNYFNNQLPFLRQNNTLATITLVSGSSVYGETPVLSYGITNSFGSAITSLAATGTPVWALSENGGAAVNQSITSTTNAGTYSLTYNSGISLGNYTIMSGVASNWTVSKAALGLSVTGTYSGSTTITPTSYTVTGLKNGESMVPTAVTVSDANVATANKYVTAITANSGNANFNNYDLAISFNATPNTTTTNTATLNPIALSVSAVASLTGNPYKGAAYTGTYTSSAMVPADAALINVSGEATGTDAGTYASNLVVTLSGSAQTNYSSPVKTNANLVVSPKTITITNTALSQNYDGITSYASLAGQTAYTNSALIGADAIGTVTQAANKTGIAQAGSFIVTPSNANLSTGNSNNYQFNYVAATHIVNPLSITVSNAAVIDKVYDGNTTASVSSGQLHGVLPIDLNNINLLPSGSFTSARVGSAIPVNLTYGLSGSAAGNYSVIQPSGLTASITPKLLDILGQKANDKVYDTTTTVVLSNGTLNGVLAGDNVSLNQWGQFIDKNAGLNKPINASNSLSGSDAGNYSLIQPSGLTASISRANLAISGLTASDKDYNASTAAVVTGAIVVTPLGGDTVTLTGTAAGLFNDTNVGLGKSVSLIGLSIDASSGDGGNYVLPSQVGLLATIRPRDLNVINTVVSNKFYDANTTASVSGGQLVGVQGSDVLVLVQSGNFADKDAGAGKAVTIHDTVSGTPQTNYNLIQPVGYTADIAPAPLTAFLTAPNKVYDGTLTASPTLNITAGLVGTEKINVSATASFNSKDVATANRVTVSSVTLTDGANGGAASNYSLVAGQTAAAQITPLALTATVSAPNKVYDATTTATPALEITAGLVGTETINVSATASFNSKDVATAALVTVNSVSLFDGDSGGIASNYSLATGQTTAAQITPASLTATVVPFTKVYDGNTHASPSLILAGWVGHDSELGVQTSATLNSKNVMQATQLTVDSVNLSNGSHGELASNYQLSSVPDGLAFVTPAPLTATVTASNKVYDGTITASPTLSITSGLVGTEKIIVSGTATFNAKDVAAANTVTVQTVALADGADGGIASNYSLVTGQTTAAQITPASLTVSDIATASAPTGTFKPGGASLLGVIGQDQVSGVVELDSPSFSAPGFLKLGDYKQTVNTLTGPDASNYLVAAFTTAQNNYTVTALPVKSTNKTIVAVAALFNLPVRSVASERINDIMTSQAIPEPVVAEKKFTPSDVKKSVVAIESQAISPPQSNIQAANIIKPNVLSVPRKQTLQAKSIRADKRDMTLIEPQVASGFTEQDIDFEQLMNIKPAAPDVFSNPSTSLEANDIAATNFSQDWEDQMYAGIRVVLQSPVTYQVLSGASSVVFLVKTLMPGWLPSFQVPVSPPSTPPVRMPVSPASIANGRTPTGRWLGLA